MNQTPTPATATHQSIVLDLLFPSPTNPRKRFDDTKLGELAESIKQQGILQPLLVREEITANKPNADKPAWPFPTRPAPSGRFEIIAGERRYRAAKLAGLNDIPCFVRNLTDAQVLHAQVIENLQRDDLHPLEEAEGYDKLMKEHGSTAESLGAEIGKSKAYIYARLKLIALCAEAREAFYADQLDASTALLIARIPVAKLQLQALKKVTEKNWQGDAMMSFRAARDYIQREFMTDLARATFPITDANLLPKVGACTECTKRTGNQPELFDDVSSKDVCTDTVCFGMKRAAHILAIQKEAEAQGQLVITGKAAKKILPNPNYNTYLAEESGYAKLSDRIPNDPKHRTYEEALGPKAFEPAKPNAKPALQKALVENTKTGELVPIVKIEDAVKALREAGFDIKPRTEAESGKRAISKSNAEINTKIEQVTRYRKFLFNTIHDCIQMPLNGEPPTANDGLYRILAKEMYEMFCGCDDAEILADRYLPQPRPDDEEDKLDALEKHIDQMTTKEHFLFIFDAIMVDSLRVNRWNLESQPKVMLEMSAVLGIDAAAIEKRLAAEDQAKAKAEEKAAKATAKKASTPKPAAQAQAEAESKPKAKTAAKSTKPKAERKAAVAA